MTNWHGGKGSKQRPTDLKKYNDNWDTIFGKKKEPMTKGKLVIYGNSSCMACLRGKQVAESVGMSYEYRDIDNPEMMQQFEELGVPPLVPVFDWNGKIYQGLTPFTEAVENTISNYGDGQL